MEGLLDKFGSLITLYLGLISFAFKNVLAELPRLSYRTFRKKSSDSSQMAHCAITMGYTPTALAQSVLMSAFGKRETDRTLGVSFPSELLSALKDLGLNPFDPRVVLSPFSSARSVVDN
jgi:cyanate permease